MPFSDAPKVIPKSFIFFSICYINWSYPISIEFCVHLFLIKIEDSIFSKLFNSLLISSYFSTFCKYPLLQPLNHTFHLLSFLSFDSFSLHCFLQAQFSLNLLFQKVGFLSQPLYIKTFLSTFLNIMPSPVLPSTVIFFNCSTIFRCSSLESPSV